MKLYNDHAYIKNEFIYPLTKDEQRQIQVKMKLLKPKKTWEDSEEIFQKSSVRLISISMERKLVRALFFMGKQKKALNNNRF